MSCNTLISIQKECTPNIGSVKEVYFILLSDIDVLAWEDYEVTDLEVTGSFVKYDTPLNSTSYTVDYTTDELGIQEFVHNVTIRISKRRPSAHMALNAFIEGNPDLVALVKDGNGIYWLLGYTRGLNVPSGSGGSGNSKSDGTFYTFELNGIERDFEIRVPQIIIDEIL